MADSRIKRLLWRIYDVAETFAQLGLASALLLSVADYFSIIAGEYTGDRWLLALYLLALELVALAFVAALLALWVSASVGISKRAGARFPRLARFEVWPRALLICLPWAGLLAWIPSSWISEHWSDLGGVGRAVAVAVYPAALVIAWVAARVLDALFRRAPEQRSVWLFRAVSAGALALAAAFYWMDRHLFVGLYDHFHYGLAALGVNAVFLGLWSLRSSRPEFEAGFARWGWRWGTRASVITALCALVILELVRPAIFGPSRSVVFAKLVETLRAASDFDDDGVSSLMGGSDCAPFDARVSPGTLDLPGNELDEDCSGTSATWPKPYHMGKYEVPKLRGKNLLIISIDALRADHLGAYGYQRKTSPNIDALAAKSVRFSRAFTSSPKTIEVFPSLMSGLYPSNIARDYSDPKLREYVKNRAAAKGQKAPKAGEAVFYRVTDNVELLADLLRDKGYSTHAATAAVSFEVLGLDRGFDSAPRTKYLTKQGGKWLKEAADQGKPFFIWLHYSRPHEPYDKQPEFPFGDRPIDRYDGEIAKDDQDIGELLRTLRQLKLEENTIVVLTADHGEEFGEHGGQFHTYNLYRELLHVPLLLKYPGVEPRVVTTPVELVDLVPTFCELLELSKSCARYDGQSLIAAIEGKRDPGRGAYAEAYKGTAGLQRRALYDGRFRLIEDFQHDRLELYDHESDPNEQRDISSEHPDIVHELMDRMTTRAWFRQGQLFTKYRATGDPMVLAKGLNVLVDDGLLNHALDQIERDLNPKYEKYLKRLHRRADVSRAIKKRAKAMAVDSRSSNRNTKTASAASQRANEATP